MKSVDKINRVYLLFVIITSFRVVFSDNPEMQPFWSKNLLVSSFTKFDSLSGSDNYYSIIDSSGFAFIRANYTPGNKLVKLGYQLPGDLCNATHLSWQWRIIAPPLNSNEEDKGRNDSGGAIYLIFKSHGQINIIKYLFSATLPEGKIIKRHPLYPIYKLFMVVTNSLTNVNKGRWITASVNFRSDYIKLYGGHNCPPLLGIGIMTDGDQTGSNVVADYGNFCISNRLPQPLP